MARWSSAAGCELGSTGREGEGPNARLSKNCQAVLSTTALQSIASGPSEPLGPLGLLGPLGPLGPLRVLGPLGPLRVLGPLGPLGPFIGRLEPFCPLGPLEPLEPFCPLSPLNPLEPLEPLSPLDPLSPLEPSEPLARAQSASRSWTMSCAWGSAASSGWRRRSDLASFMRTAACSEAVCGGAERAAEPAARRAARD